MSCSPICSVCGNLQPCSCPTPIDGCAVLSGPSQAPCSSDCGCGPIAQSCPQPYYAEVGSCPEDHTKVTCIRQFYTSIKNSNAWNIPACGATSVVIFPDVNSILLGSFIWNTAYGYYEVVSFNPNTHEVGLRNNCNDGNASPGITVAPCNEFIVTPPSCCTGGGSQNPDIFPYVAIDFTAPANGTCIDITVTSVAGLIVGKNVQIGSGIYRVNGISSGTLINICNDGDGITPGTPVIARNLAGDYQYPVILIDTNPCTNPTTLSGSLLACDSGTIQPLTGVQVGQVPVLQDPATGECEYQNLSIPTNTCTNLTASLTITNGVANYSLIVADSTQFAINDIVQIGNRSDRLTITGLPDSTHIAGTLAPVPGSSGLVPIGTSVCLIGCCEDLQNQLDALSAIVTTQGTAIGVVTNEVTNITGQSIQTQTTAGFVPATLESANPVMAVITADISFTNTTAKNMRIWISAKAGSEGDIVGGNTNEAAISYNLNLQIDPGGFASMILHPAGMHRRYFELSDAATEEGNFLSTAEFYVLAPSNTITMRAAATLGWQGDAVASYDVANLQCSLLAVAITI